MIQEPLAWAVSEWCGAHPQEGTKKGQCFVLFLDADVMGEHVGGPLSAVLRVYCPRQISFCSTLISRVEVWRAFATLVLHQRLGIMGNKLFIFFYILHFQPRFMAVEK